MDSLHSNHSPSTDDVWQAARAARLGGLRPVPIKEDGSKRPDLNRWKQYQDRAPTEDEVSQAFAQGRTGLGTVIPPGWEVLDFEGRALAEGLYERFIKLTEAAELSDVLRQITNGYLEQTPSGGRHIFYRTPNAGSEALAYRPATAEELLEAPKEKQKLLVERLGPGKVAILAPSHGQVHPSGKPYVLLRGSFEDIESLSPEGHEGLLEILRSLNEIPLKVVPVPRQVGGSTGNRPGDRFGQRTGWEEILAPHGWQHLGIFGGWDHYSRPGKVPPGTSATVSPDGEMLYVFTTSTVFEANRAYSKFAAYAYLNHSHDGSVNWKAAVDAVQASEAGPQETEPDYSDVPDEPGRKILQDVTAVLDRYLILPDHPHGRNAVALWIAHAHAVDCFESTPRLAALSPEPNSGKTRLLEVIESLVPGPIRTENISTAALFRVLARGQAVTVLMDEIDAVFGPKATEHEDLRGILNAGHRRDGMVYRCVGDGSRQDVTAFPVYGPVALAGLGQLPETLLSRSIVLPMRRRARDEPVEPWRVRDGGVENRLLLRRLAAWVKRHEEEIGATRPRLPAGVTDRAADVWEPLLAIAEVAGGKNWPRRAFRAAEHFVSRQQGEGQVSLGLRLLGDCKTIFYPKGQQPRSKTSSADLLDQLRDLPEAPWANMKGTPLSSYLLTKLLGNYNIRTKNIRLKVPIYRTDKKGDACWVRDEEKILKGFEREMFDDAWNRYLPETPDGGPQEEPGS